MSKYKVFNVRKIIAKLIFQILLNVCQTFSSYSFKRFQFLVRCFSLTNDQVQNGFCPGPYMVTSDQAFFLR